MRREDVPNELLVLARQHGIDVNALPKELTDHDLEAVVGGKQGIPTSGLTPAGQGLFRVLGANI